MIFNLLQYNEKYVLNNRGSFIKDPLSKNNN